MAGLFMYANQKLILLMSFLTVPFIIFIIWILYLANTGQNSIFFDFFAGIPHGDKLGHFCLFGFLTLGANFTLKLKKISFISFNAYVGAVLVLLFVLVEELSQYYIPNRTLEAGDILANTAGIIVFSLITKLISLKAIND